MNEQQVQQMERQVKHQHELAEMAKFEKREGSVSAQKRPRLHEESKRKFAVFKYTGCGKLAEAVIVGGTPCFLQLDGEQVSIFEHIEEQDRILIPYKANEYPNEPYSFSSLDEIRDLVEIVRKISIDDLYLKLVNIWTTFNDTSRDNVIILVADTLFSYFQDKLGMTHYLSLVGDNGSGKNSILSTFQYTGYRPVLFSSATPANIYQVLGQIEKGQVTILLDEANDIDRSTFMMDVLKTGYKSDGKVARIDTSSGRTQYFFYTFCFKMIAGERSLGNQRAKGLLDRSFILYCYPGKPQHKIHKILNPAGDKRYEKSREELMKLRKILLLYRILHFNEPIQDVRLSVDGRDEELCSSLMRLFQNTRAANEVASVLSKFIGQRQVRKNSTLESFLYKTIGEMIESQKTNILPSSLIWSTVVSVLPGERISDVVYKSVDFGTFSQKMVIGILKDKFGAESRSDGVKRFLQFSEQKLQSLKGSYGIGSNVQIINSEMFDGSYTFDTFFEQEKGQQQLDIDKLPIDTETPFLQGVSSNNASNASDASGKKIPVEQVAAR